MPDLLLEFFSEEIPARMQARAAEDLRKAVTDRLVAAGLVYEGAKAFVTPRRLTLCLLYTSLIIISIGLAIPLIITYVQEGIVPRLPTAVLSTGLMLLAFLSIACGLILDTVTRGRREQKLIAYLTLRAPGEERRRS